MAMVGGGPGSLIGPVHRMAAELDGEIELVAGAFSRDPAKSALAGRSYRIDAERVYPSYQDLLAGERRNPKPAHFVAVVTPNASHHAIAKLALEHGFHVLCEKPATATLAEALELEALLRRAPRVYALAYTYAGYPLVREARALCRGDELGKIRKVVVEYSQGWLSERIELADHKQASWRTEPAHAGAGGCLGDIGVHAFHLLEHITGCKVVELCAQLSSVVEGRVLDDDCNVLLRLDNGAPALLHATQIAAGERNRLQIRVSGERGSLAWSHEDPQRLHIAWLSGRSETRHAGSPDLSVEARAATRLPAGHPEGYIEAFANIYRDFAAVLRRRAADESSAWSESLCGISDGVRGMRFIERAVTSATASTSHHGRAGWVPFD